MKHLTIKLSLFINYFVFAVLLNSVGTVILQVQASYGVSASGASVLEAFKDLSIALTSLLVASFIVRIGYKRSMLIGLAIVGLACMAMPQLPAFWMTKLLFASIGVSFALIKISVFATLGLVTDSRKEHVSLMNFIEAFFMVGVLSGYFIFSGFVNDLDPGSAGWLRVYYVLGTLSFAAFALLLTARLDESRVVPARSTGLAKDFVAMIKLCARPLVLVFVVSAFLYVLIEQSIMSWLPTFNNRILKLPASLSIEMASILAASTALGRFLAGFAFRWLDWHKVLTVGMLLAAALVLICLPLADNVDASHVTSWFDAPIAAYIFPLIGLCIAPVYPAINSVILSSLPAQQHAPMAGLIVLFSALGGTSGSIVTGTLFEVLGGRTAFYFSLVPIALLLLTLYFFKSKADSEQQVAGHAAH